MARLASLRAAMLTRRLEVRWANGPTVAYEVPAIDAEWAIDQARGVVRAERARPGAP